MTIKNEIPLTRVILEMTGDEREALEAEFRTLYGKNVLGLTLTPLLFDIWNGI